MGVRSRSRVGMLFKEALLGQIPSTLICALDPSLEAANASLKSLQTASYLRSVCTNYRKSIHAMKLQPGSHGRSPTKSVSSLGTHNSHQDHSVISTVPPSYPGHEANTNTNTSGAYSMHEYMSFGNENIDTLNAACPPAAPSSNTSVHFADPEAEEEKEERGLAGDASTGGFTATDLGTIAESEAEGQPNSPGAGISMEDRLADSLAGAYEIDDSQGTRGQIDISQTQPYS